MRNKLFLFFTYFFSLVMIVISIFAIYAVFFFKSFSKRTAVQMNVGEVKQIVMVDRYRNTNKVIITDKYGIKSVLYLMREMEKTPVCFARRKTIIIKGDKGELSFGVYKDCIGCEQGQFICDVNIEKYITDVYGKQ